MSCDELYWIWFAELTRGHGFDFRDLFKRYSSPAELYHMEWEEIERIDCISHRLKALLCNRELEGAMRILDRCQQMGIGIAPYQSELYPSSLLDMRDPPAVLYFAGEMPNFQAQPSIAMVGSRRMSVYGTETAYKISYELASAGAIVISGMAAGIDGICSAGALKAGGVTAAVLGCGLDITYPKHHGRLMQRIADHGVLISEFPPGVRPVSFHFPMRNRIISALSHGVVVVEAGAGSGSLITAKRAVEQGRVVFAIPAYGDGFGNESANGLLREGATFATSALDILNRFYYAFPSGVKFLSTKRRREPECDYAYLKEIGVIGLDFSEARGEIPSPMGSARRYRAENGEEEAAEPPTREKKPRERRSEARPVEAKTSEESPSVRTTPDEVLQSLDPISLAILQTMPDDRAVAMDELNPLGYSSGEIMTALTMLELTGLIQKLPGALYTKI